MILYDDSICTCDQRQHACSPPCKAHPERGGGLGDPGVADTEYEAFKRWFNDRQAQAPRPTRPPGG
jgi:hypothetical protein